MKKQQLNEKAEMLANEKAEMLANEKAETLANEISKMKNKIYMLEKSIIQKKKELICICPHKKIHEEWDDDFYKPRRYMLCLICGEEINTK